MIKHYAKVVDGIVQKVICAEPVFFDTFIDTSPGSWIETDFKTRAGVHENAGTPLRKNYAGVGYSYDQFLDAFIPPKPYPSWTLDESTGLWDAPSVKPAGDYYWDEDTLAWIATT